MQPTISKNWFIKYVVSVLCIRTISLPDGMNGGRNLFPHDDEDKLPAGMGASNSPIPCSGMSWLMGIKCGFLETAHE